MRLVSTNGLSDIQVLLAIFMADSDPDPCVPEDQIWVKATDLDGQSALFFHNTNWTRGAWTCKDVAGDSFLVLFQEREPGELVNSVLKRPVIGRFQYCNVSGPHSAETVIMKFVLQGELPKNLNPDTIQCLNTSVKKVAP